MIRPAKLKSFRLLMPVAGCVLFVVLYVAATLLYPGGSQVNTHAVGFSWLNNYWCDLLHEMAMDGQPNPAKPVALAGMVVICLTLASFWLLFPTYIDVGKIVGLTMQISGTLAMMIAPFLFTSRHDIVLNLASFFGLIATIGTFVGLYRVQWYRIFVAGLLNPVLLGVNNYIYYTTGLIVYLPLVQKISFAAFLAWTCCISIRMYYRLGLNDDHSGFPLSPPQIILG